MLGPRRVPGLALTVDVEEWYHTCWVPEYVDPARRPRLPEELGRLLPELLDLLAASGSRATFFVLGEVATRWPHEVRRIAAEGHEVASHGFLHRRAGELSPERFRADLRRARETLEQVAGQRVTGYRAPEWSLRSTVNPRLRILAEEGFVYDSSLAPYAGAGRRSNPTQAFRLAWPDGLYLDELPPLVWGGRLRLPASGWVARLAPVERMAAAARAHSERGGLAVAVVHPWELSTEATPGELTGLGRFVHETGRRSYRRRFERLLALDHWGTVGEALAAVPDHLAEVEGAVAATPMATLGEGLGPAASGAAT